MLHLGDLIVTNYICSDLISQHSHILRYLVLGLQHIFLEDVVLSITAAKIFKIFVLC